MLKRILVYALIGVTLLPPAAASGTGMGTGLYASAGLSYAGTRTESATRTHASVGSSVVSAGDIVFSASGDMAQIGSDALSKEASVYYEIGRDLLLAASDNTYSSRSKTSSKSASVSVGTNGVGSAGVGVSRGKTSSMEVVWDNAASTAQNGSIVYDVGNDMRADGYNALAGRITAGVGGGLDLFSKQGSTESSGSSSGFNAGISSGLYASANAGIIAGTSVDGGFSQSKESGNRNWVDDRSSLIGTESVEISARGSLRLAGSQIANVKDGVDGGNLRIFAGDLSWEDIKNTQEERSAGFGLQTGFSLTGDKKAGAGGALVPLGPGNERAGVTRDSGGEYKSGGTTLTAGHGGRELEGLTLATVGQGEFTLGSGRDISGLNRDVTAMDVITGDVVTGALEAEVTLDHRLLSAAGREEIAGQVSALPENLAQSAEGAAKGAANLGKATADSVTAIGEGLFGGSGLGEAFAQADRQIVQMQADHEFRVQYAEMQTALDDPNASFEAKRDALEKKHEIDKKYNLAHPGSEAILYALQNDVYQDEDGSWRFRQGSSFSADDLNLLGINLSDSGGLIIDGRTLAAVKAHEGRESQTGSLDERTAHAQANKAAEYAAKNHDWANWLNGIEGKDVQTAVDDWLADGNASSAALAAGDLLYLLLEGDQTRNMYDSTSISFETSAILDPEAGDPRRVTYWEAAYYVAAASRGVPVRANNHV